MDHTNCSGEFILQKNTQRSENLADQSVTGDWRQSASCPFIQTLSVVAEVEPTYQRAGLVIFYISEQNFSIFTVRLHVMQSNILPRHFCRSVCLSVCQTCALWHERNLCWLLTLH